MRVVAFGKAVIGMITAVQELLGERIQSGIGVVPSGIRDDLLRHHKQSVSLHSTVYKRSSISYTLAVNMII